MVKLNEELREQSKVTEEKLMRLQESNKQLQKDKDSLAE